MRIEINPPGVEPLIEFTELRASDKYDSFHLTRETILALLDSGNNDKFSDIMVLLPSLYIDLMCLPFLGIGDILNVVKEKKRARNGRL